MTFYISNDESPDDYIMAVDSAERAEAECNCLRIASDYECDYTAYVSAAGKGPPPGRSWRVAVYSTDDGRTNEKAVR